MALASDPDPATATPTETNPWYLRPFFGTRVLPTEARHILRLVALGLYFENYDMGLINAALPQIADDLAIAAEDTGFYLSAIRLGGVGTFLMLPLADRLGRKRLFLFSLMGMAIGTLATGLSMTPVQFTLAQSLTRVFMLAAAALALVIVVEEFPAEQRGAGLGLLALLGGLGYGTCALLYSIVDLLPWGWRSLYLIGFAPALLLPFFRRSLPETRRFEEHQRARGSVHARSQWAEWTAPMLALLHASPRRTITVGLAAFLSAVGGIAFFQYTSMFVQTAHGWTPAGYAGLVMAGGAIGVLGSILGGRGSDRWGRRLIGCTALIFAPLFAFAFLFGPESALVVSWGLFIFCSSAGDVVLRALSAELFPTSHRGTATGWMMLVQTLGWTLGLLLVGLGTESVEDLSRTIAALSLVMIVAGFALLAVPETHGRELETISEESEAA